MESYSWPEKEVSKRAWKAKSRVLKWIQRGKLESVSFVIKNDTLRNIALRIRARKLQVASMQLRLVKRKLLMGMIQGMIQ